MLSFQQIILRLQAYWAEQGCALLQPYDMEVGAGTSHTATFLRALGPEPWKAGYVQPSRRPKDGRYGDNPNRLQHYYQYQVVLKPAPADILELYLGSLEALGFDLKVNDIRFVEDDWENPTLGCWGLGWEVWLNGMEVTQFTYFQQVGGIDCKPITGEITYGLERLAMYLQGVDSVYKLAWTDGLSYGDVYHQNEVEQSTYNFEHSDVEFLLQAFGAHERQSKHLMAQQLALPAYEQLLKAGHSFNLLDARGAISVTERAAYIGRIRNLARAVAQSYLESRARLGFPMAPRAWGRRGDGADRTEEGGCGMTTTARNLLVELFVEELPPKALKMLGEAFAQSIAEALAGQQLRQPLRDWTAFASPRRLAVHVPQVAVQAADRVERIKLMPVAVGLAADGRATPALAKKLAALGADADAVATLSRQLDGKGETLFLERTVSGATLAEGLQAALDEAIARLPIPKVMQYQLADGWTSVNFVRPAHGLVALHGADVVPVRALGLEAGRQTRGHRFEALLDPVMLQDADHYARQLEEQGAVIASFAARRAEIVRQLDAHAAALGLEPVDDPALLDEVTALVERPNVVACRFDEPFLEVPQECLILTMKVNQKYFPLLDAEGRLSHHFLVVANIRPGDASRVVQGNERVVRPRLADAKFFFDQDRKRTLASRVPALDKVVYHGKLGTLGNRTSRVSDIAKTIGRTLGGEVLETRAFQAANLAKADLLTDMVGEFPELQGIMGRYYAKHDDVPDDVAFAIEDHYKPRFSGDELPRNMTGVVVALADKLETLVGLFGIGQVPTGDKDPFALRRHALGVIRILVERDLKLDLQDLLKIASGAFEAVDDDPRATADLAFGGKAMASRALLTDFLYDRLAGSLREQGYGALEVDAVLSLRPDRLAEVRTRLSAVRAFASLPEATALAAANKRVGNILKKTDGDVEARVDISLLSEPAEAALYAAVASVKLVAEAAFERGDYAASLQLLAALRGPVDAFFDAVMVNADDPRLRANRLGLLAMLHAAMNRIADLSKLAA